MDGSATPGRRRLVHMIWLCGPLVLWLAVVAVASTDIASEAHTKAWLVSFIHLFARGYGAGSSGSSSSLGALMWAIRKTAHVIEYGVLGFLLARGSRVCSRATREVRAENCWGGSRWGCCRAVCWWLWPTSSTRPS